MNRMRVPTSYFPRHIKMSMRRAWIKLSWLPFSTEQAGVVIEWQHGQRYEHSCCYHPSENHSLRECPMFKQKKKYLTKSSYLVYHSKLNSTSNSIDIKPHDEVAFCAAGILAYRLVNSKPEILMILENRDDTGGENYGFNFPGGGRESVCLESDLRPETSLETARSEFREEVGEILGDNCTLVKAVCASKPSFAFWYGPGKFCLYGINVSSTQQNQEDGEVLKLKWIDVDLAMKLAESRSSDFHKFTIDMIMIMNKLTTLKDILL